GITKIGDVMAGLKGMGNIEIPKIGDGAFALPEGALKLPDGAIQLPKGTAIPDGAAKLPDGTIKLPEGTTTFPPGTVKLPVDGPPQFMDPKGNIYKADGSLSQHISEAPKAKPDAGAGIPRVDPPKVDSPATARIPELELAGVGARGGDDVIRLGSDISDPVRAADHAPTGRPDLTPTGRPDLTPTGRPDLTPTGRAGDHTPGGSAYDHGNGPSASHEPPTGGGRTDGPGGTSTGHGDGPGAGGHTDGPSGGGHTDTPSGGGHTDTPSGGSHTDTPSGGGRGDSGGTGHGDGPGASGGSGSGEHPVLSGASEPRPDGARYVEEPTPEHHAAARYYDQVRANPESLDIRSISENTGISTQVLDRVRTHFFLTEHVVTQAPGAPRLAYFTPRSDIADLWRGASEGTLTRAEETLFERYIGHEFTESHFIEAGIPYVRDAEHLWGRYDNGGGDAGFYHEWPGSYHDAGAHELALKENNGRFSQWPGLGLDLPNVELAPGLANIDEVTAALLQELRSKGIVK
ncbi:hypothetical protein ACWGIF_30105, partial [Streptomyces sp. NPDC054849]